MDDIWSVMLTLRYTLADLKEPCPHPTWSLVGRAAFFFFIFARGRSLITESRCLSHLDVTLVIVISHFLIPISSLCSCLGWCPAQAEADRLNLRIFRTLGPYRLYIHMYFCIQHTTHAYTCSSMIFLSTLL